MNPRQLLWVRVHGIARFARTGSFDFVELLDMLGLVKAEARSCYLKGSTGPRDGAKLLWPGKKLAEHEKLAVQLAADLGVSCVVLEDALCNWWKQLRE